MNARIDTKPILILGVGNILMKDEGVGVYIVNSILETGADLPDTVEVMDGGTAGFDLVPLMMDRKRIIIVDALSMGDAPGSIYRFKPEDALESRRSYSLHDVGILNVIRTLRMTGENPEIEIIGIVPQDISTMDISLSEAVARAVPRAVSIVLEAVMQ